MYPLTLRVQKPDIYDESQFPQKTLLLGDKEVARYNGKLNPVTVSVELPDEMTDALVAFSSDVKRELMERRS